MDLSLIQTHIDNFVDTWEGWGKVFGNVDDIFQGLARLVNFLGREELGSSDFFPNTDKVVNPEEAAA
ncbi:MULTISPECIES: hypothetical protein [unclassified Corynebacterium]|uniref:hypothetical protein n=1 Tax=unclassified Corynebacterium TaxID=2624378 RepID=UPI0034CD592B